MCSGGGCQCVCSLSDGLVFCLGVVLSGGPVVAPSLLLYFIVAEGERERQRAFRIMKVSLA